MRAIEDIAEFKQVDDKAVQKWVRKQNATTRKGSTKRPLFESSIGNVN